LVDKGGKDRSSSFGGKIKVSYEVCYAVGRKRPAHLPEGENPLFPERELFKLVHRLPPSFWKYYSEREKNVKVLFYFAEKRGSQARGGTLFESEQIRMLSQKRMMN